MSTITSPLRDSGTIMPGFYRSMPFADYRAIDAINHSGLDQLKRSPAHYVAAKSAPREQTEAMLIGSALDCLYLEPKLFDRQFAVMAKIDRRTTAGKEAFAAFQSKHAGKTILTTDQMEQVQGMADALKAHADASALASFLSDSQLTAVWLDPATGLLCKGRIDGDCPELSTLIDLKSSADASRREFERSIFKFGYHRQAAMYLDACKALGAPRDHFAFVVVEKTAPYAVAVYRLKDDVIELGRRENAALLSLYAQCLSTDTWPGYPAGVQDIGIPAWAAKQIQEDYAL